MKKLAIIMFMVMTMFGTLQIVSAQTEVFDIDEPDIEVTNVGYDRISFKLTNVDSYYRGALYVEFYDESDQLVASNSWQVLAGNHRNYEVTGLDESHEYRIEAWLEVDEQDYYGTSDTAIKYQETNPEQFILDADSIEINITQISYTSVTVQFTNPNDFPVYLDYDIHHFVGAWTSFKSGYIMALQANASVTYTITGLSPDTDYRLFAELLHDIPPASGGQSGSYAEDISPYTAFTTLDDSPDEVFDIDSPSIHAAELTYNYMLIHVTNVDTFYRGILYINLYDESNNLVESHSYQVNPGVTVSQAFYDLLEGHEYRIETWLYVDEQEYFGTSDITVEFYSTSTFPTLYDPNVTLEEVNYNNVLFTVTNDNEIMARLVYYVNGVRNTQLFSGGQTRSMRFTRLTPNTENNFIFYFESLNPDDIGDSNEVEFSEFTPEMLLPSVDSRIDNFLDRAGLGTAMGRTFMVVMTVLLATILLGLAKASGYIIIIVDIIILLTFMALGIIPLWVTMLIALGAFFMVMAGTRGSLR
jgi:hypothetical protein